MKKCSAIALLTLAGTALADLPEAMDRVPSDAYLVASVGNMQAFATEVTEMTEALNIPGAADQLGMFMGMMTNMPGLDPTGSAAFAIIGEDIDFGADEGPVVAVLPVPNFDEFVQALEGTPGSGLIELNMQGETVYARNIGGGYAAVGPMADVLSGFEGEAGNAAGFESRIGRAGSGILDSSDVTVVMNIKAMEPQFREGFEGMRENMEMMGAMSGQDMTQQIDMMSEGFEAFMRDARAGIMGLDLDGAGIGFDLAVNFAEGSEMAQLSTGEADAGGVLKGVPDMPFLFAWSMDFSSATTKDVMKAVYAMNPGTGAIMSDMIDKVDGMSGVMGSVPAVFGGMFSNTVFYWQTDDPASFRESMGTAITSMNGQEANGVRHDTMFTANAKDVAGTKVDEWGMRMDMSGAPGGDQAAMAMQMLFGPAAGPAGYLAETDGGVVMTVAKNSSVIEKASNANGGLARNASIVDVSRHLPSNRSFEAYVGVGEIMKTAMGVMQMMGQGGNFPEVPANLHPIALGGTSSDGAFHFSLFVPSDVITTFSEMGQAMNAGANGF